MFRVIGFTQSHHIRQSMSFLFGIVLSMAVFEQLQKHSSINHPSESDSRLFYQKEELPMNCEIKSIFL